MEICFVPFFSPKDFVHVFRDEFVRSQRRQKFLFSAYCPEREKDKILDFYVTFVDPGEYGLTIIINKGGNYYYFQPREISSICAFDSLRHTVSLVAANSLRIRMIGKKIEEEFYR